MLRRLFGRRQVVLTRKGTQRSAYSDQRTNLKKTTRKKRHKRRIGKKVRGIFKKFIARPVKKKLKKKKVQKKRKKIVRAKKIIKRLRGLKKPKKFKKLKKVKKPKKTKKRKKVKTPKKPKKHKKRKKVKKFIERRSKMVEEKPKEAKAKEKEIGEVTHFFQHVDAAVIKLKEALSEGDTIHVKGHTTDFTEQVASMQIDNKPIKEGKKGDEVGLLVKNKVRRGDIVYKEIT